ncbi:MAG: HAMP domain-containing histidine kinase [Oscillospiraceae bacterium]|jgi:signal transduction histidine kinase|nr:HAMP domain-containing histidine kinase [Oscillospiraceae bacterium]
MKKRFHFKSIYLRFAVIFLSIWWGFNGITFGIIIGLMSDGQLEEMRRLTGITFLNAAAIGTLVILLALRGIVKPIKKLSNASREVAKGKFDVAVEIENRDEIGRLAADFNAMVREIGSLDKMRREFVSNVSHEFRTPITSIRGFAKLIAENADDTAAVREYGDTIVRESERLIALSSNLLRLSELDTKTIHNESVFNLDEQLRQVVLTLEPHWEPKNIEFDIDLPEASFTGDEELLRQVWLNLIQNAIKFSPVNGVIKIELNKIGGSVRVTVTDNGVGISAEELPRIFDRFQKGSASGGNGLGLAIAQKIVEVAGGTIWAESEVGRGASFTVALPTGR